MHGRVTFALLASELRAGRAEALLECAGGRRSY